MADGVEDRLVATAVTLAALVRGGVIGCGALLGRVGHPPAIAGSSRTSSRSSTGVPFPSR